MGVMKGQVIPVLHLQGLEAPYGATAVQLSGTWGRGELRRSSHCRRQHAAAQQPSWHWSYVLARMCRPDLPCQAPPLGHGWSTAPEPPSRARGPRMHLRSELLLQTFQCVDQSHLCLRTLQSDSTSGAMMMREGTSDEQRGWGARGQD